MSHESWKIERFEKSLHDRSGFDCGAASLNDWLQTKVSQYERRDLARTYLLVTEHQDSIRGYYALSNHPVVFDALTEDQTKGLPRMDVPVVLIGRLAIDQSVQGQGLGEIMLIDALRRCQHVADEMGIRAVEVDAINESARQFYLKYGFVPLQDDQRHLFLPTSVIRKLKLPSL